MIRELMSSRRFAPLFWAQFCAALNDNVLKNGLVIILLYGAATTHGGTLVTVAGAVFIFPFFVLSGLGGELADKYVKSVVARRLKFVEIFAAVFAAVGFFSTLDPVSVPGALHVRIVAALFGPVKYAILPDQLSVGELATGNALVEGATFLAILIGTIAGGLLVSGSTHMGWVASAIVLLAFLAWAFASRIPTTTPSAPELAITANPWTSTLRLLKSLYGEPRLWDGMLIVSWFWLAGAVVLSLLPALIKDVVGGTEAVVTLCLAVFAIGVAAGSLLPRSFPCSAQSRGGADRRDRDGHFWPRHRLGGRPHHVRLRYHAVGLRHLVQWPAPHRGLRDLCLRRRPVRGAVLCGRAGVVGAFRTRARDRRRQHPAGRLHGGRLAGRRIASGGRASIAWIFFGLAIASFGSVFFVLGKWGKEGVRDFGGFVFRRCSGSRCAASRTSRARDAHDHRAQPRQPARRPAAARRAADRRRLRRRYRHRDRLVGQAVHEDDPPL